MPTGSALAFFGGFGGIVFDPSNFVENVRQALALLETIDRASTQIRQQQRMLADLPVTVANALSDAGDALHDTLAAGESSPDIGVQLDARYPIDTPGDTPAWLDGVQPLWTEAQRDALLHEREVYSMVYDQATPSAERLAQLIEASNGVHAASNELPGVMAVAQAHHELLAACSGEVDKLIALRVVRTQRRIETRASVQSEAAYHLARRTALLRDWTTETPTFSRPAESPF
jgi:conjugal transfer/entry exclusion protein